MRTALKLFSSLLLSFAISYTGTSQDHMISRVFPGSEGTASYMLFEFSNRLFLSHRDSIYFVSDDASANVMNDNEASRYDGIRNQKVPDSFVSYPSLYNDYSEGIYNVRTSLLELHTTEPFTILTRWESLNEEHFQGDFYSMTVTDDGNYFIAEVVEYGDQYQNGSRDKFYNKHVFKTTEDAVTRISGGIVALKPEKNPNHNLIYDYYSGQKALYIYTLGSSLDWSLPRVYYTDEGKLTAVAESDSFEVEEFLGELQVSLDETIMLLSGYYTNDYGNIELYKIEDGRLKLVGDSTATASWTNYARMYTHLPSPVYNGYLFYRIYEDGGYKLMRTDGEYIFEVPWPENDGGPVEMTRMLEKDEYGLYFYSDEQSVWRYDIHNWWHDTQLRNNEGGLFLYNYHGDIYGAGHGPYPDTDNFGNPVTHTGYGVFKLGISYNELLWEGTYTYEADPFGLVVYDNRFYFNLEEVWELQPHFYMVDPGLDLGGPGIGEPGDPSDPGDPGNPADPGNPGNPAYVPVDTQTALLYRFNAPDDSSELGTVTEEFTKDGKLVSYSETYETGNGFTLENTYDSSGLLIRDESAFCTAEGCDNKARTEYGYYQDGSLRTKIIQLWDPADNSWKNFQKMVYDSLTGNEDPLTGNEEPLSTYNWDEAQNRWNGETKDIVRSYDSLGRLTEEAYSFSYTGEEPSPHRKIVYIYQDSLLAAEETWLWRQESSTYELYIRTGYTYNPDGILVADLTQYKYTGVDTMTNRSRNEYQVNLSGQVIEHIVYYWYADIRDWLPTARYTYIYDEYGNVTEEDSFRYNSDLQEFVLNRTKKYLFDMNGKKLLEESISPDGGDWKSVFGYDTSGNLISQANYSRPDSTQEYLLEFESVRRYEDSILVFEGEYFYQGDTSAWSEAIKKYYSWTYAPDPKELYIISEPDTLVRVDSLFSYLFMTEAGENDTVLITALILPSWLGFSDNADGTATLSGTPAASDEGSHEVNIRAVNGYLSEEQGFTIQVLGSVEDTTGITEPVDTSGVNQPSDSTGLEEPADTTEVTGIENGQELNLSVYPNPVRDILHVVTDRDRTVTVELLDFRGRVLLAESSYNPEHRIDMVQLPAGIYFIRITDPEHRSRRTMKVLKQ